MKLGRTKTGVGAKKDLTHIEREGSAGKKEKKNRILVKGEDGDRRDYKRGGCGNEPTADQGGFGSWTELPLETRQTGGNADT